MTDDEMKLLETIAASRKVTVEELIAELTPVQAFATPEEPMAPPDSSQETDEPTVVFVRSPEKAPEESPPLPPPADENDTDATETEAQNPEFKGADPGSLFHICRQCGWDQRAPAIAEPTRKEVMDFLYVSLGRKVYSKEYSRFDGRVKLRLRTLYVRELEALYEAAYIAQKAGVINTPTEYYDYINRMRLYLQISRLMINTDNPQVVFDLPHVLDKSFAPTEGLDWIDKLKQLGRYQEKVPLMTQVQSFIVDDVLITETLQRIATDTCATFNRLVAMLEMRVKDENFWKETEMLT
jgi:hypothetical protein